MITRTDKELAEMNSMELMGELTRIPDQAHCDVRVNDRTIAGAYNGFDIRDFQAEVVLPTDQLYLKLKDPASGGVTNIQLSVVESLSWND